MKMSSKYNYKQILEKRHILLENERSSAQYSDTKLA